MNCSVKIPTPLRRYTNGASVVPANGGHVEEVLRNLQNQFPGLGERLFDGNGTVKSHLNIFLNAEDIRFLQGVNTAVREGDMITLLPALAGGSHR
jgi:molybdopterin synthase sulfur carrier subunit